MKKSFRIAPEFIAFIDYKANYLLPFHYAKLDANEMLDAMDETETMFHDSVYMIVLLKKTNELHEGGLIYRGCLATRDGCTWHRNDRTHNEIEWIIRYDENGNCEVIG